MKPNTLAVFVPALIVLAVPAASQIADPRAVAARADQLQQQGDWQAALDTLAKGRESCPPVDENPACVLRMDYTAGYVFERQSSVSTDRSEAFLTRAAHFYGKVLEKSPPHGATRRRLAGVYQQLGRGDEALALLDSRTNDTPAEKARLKLRRAEVLEQLGQDRRALTAYIEASTLGPDNETAARGILRILRDRPMPARLFSLAEKWEEQFPSTAADAYLTVIRQSYADNPERADSSLLRWAALIAKDDSLALGRLDSLPPRWNAASIAGLRSYLRNPRKRLSRNWWLEEAKRRHVLGKIALRLGDEPRLAKGDPRWSLDCWKTALTFVPNYDEYIRERSLAGEDLVRLELQTALARLYAANPSLDPDGRGIQPIELDLFQGKAAAYYRADRKAIQEHHTVLGLIYSDRKQWSGTGANNAIFQLEHAIRTAERRRDQGAAYQPLAALKERLAAAHAGAGENKKAAKAYIQSARAFLDTDDISAAARQLSAASKLPGTLETSDQAAVDTLESMTKLRRLAREPSNSMIRDLSDPRLLSKLQASSEIPRSREWKEFLDRQSFKFSADAAISLNALAKQPNVPDEVKAGAGRASLAAAALALNAAVTRPGSLVGGRDVVRVRGITKLVDESVGQYSGGFRTIQSQELIRDQGSTAIEVAIPGRSMEKTWIYLPERTVVAGEVVGQVGADAWVDSGAKLTVSADQIEVRGGSSTGTITAEIKKINWLKTTRRVVRRLKIARPNL